MAKLGDSIDTPELGWKRYPLLSQTVSSFPAGVTWANRDNGNAPNTLIHIFKFQGTKLRILAYAATDRATNASISIDGGPKQLMPLMNGGAAQNRIIFESTELANDMHTVQIWSGSNGSYANLYVQAFDIDATKRAYHPDEVTDPYEMKVGSRIRCNYKSVSGTPGRFAGLGEETGGFMDSAAAAPDGDFYFTMVDTSRGAKKLIADRVVQGGLPWDTLNLEGYASPVGRPVGATVYVDALNGRDDWPGTLLNPVRTLSKAIEVGRSGDNIKLAAGVYAAYTLHDLCVAKGFTYIGENEKTVIELQYCYQNYSQPISFASFQNLLIRPADDYAGDTRVFWYNTAGITSRFSLRFDNVVFTTSLNGKFPTTNGFYWTNGGSANPNVRFTNCTSSLKGAFDGTSGSITRLINSIFAGPSAVSASVASNCLQNAVISSDFKSDGDTSGIGVYAGKFPFASYRYSEEASSRIVRILSGGYISTDSSNEWYRYIQRVAASDPKSVNAANWGFGALTWMSTTHATSPGLRILRGSDASTWTYAASSSQAGGFRPVMLLTLPLAAKFVGELNPATLHSLDSLLTGSVTSQAQLKAGYRILVNGSQLYPATGYTAEQSTPFDVSYTIPNGRLVLGTNTITVEVLTGAAKTSWTSTINLVSEVPHITAAVSGMLFNASIIDADEDTLRYRILLNGNQIHPPDPAKPFTELLSGPVKYSRIFRSAEAPVGKTSTVTVIAEDRYGAASRVDIDFEGQYYNLMFSDEQGNYYSDDIEDVLMYLDFGDVIAGQTTPAYPVLLHNLLDFTVRNVLLTRDGTKLPEGTRVEISRSDSPFVAEDALLIQEPMQYKDQRTIYVRIVTDANGKPGSGEFDVSVQADPA